MKILFFIESLRSGGKERRLVELIKGLAKNPDIEMEIVLTKEEIHYTDVLATNIKIHYTVRKKGLKKDPRIFYKFYKVAKKVKPDVIHVWGNLVAIYAIPAKVLLRIPMVNSQIADAPENIGNSILSHRLSFPFSDKILANSYAGLRAYSAPEKKSSVIYNGFDFTRVSNIENKSSIRNNFNITTKLVVGMVASFSDMKDYTSYIQAANKILKNTKEVTFLCIGSGDDSVYQQMVAIENIGRVLFLGKQNNVENIMNICDIGVLSTYTEGISNALLEFAALGKPVVTTFGGGNIELVDHEETGYLVNQKSPEKLAEKIEILLKDKKKRVEFGGKAKEKVFQQFSIENMISDFTNTYIKVIKENR